MHPLARISRVSPAPPRDACARPLYTLWVAVCSVMLLALIPLCRATAPRAPMSALSIPVERQVAVQQPHAHRLNMTARTVIRPFSLSLGQNFTLTLSLSEDLLEELRGSDASLLVHALRERNVAYWVEVGGPPPILLSVWGGQPPHISTDSNSTTAKATGCSCSVENPCFVTQDLPRLPADTTNDTSNSTASAPSPSPGSAALEWNNTFSYIDELAFFSLLASAYLRIDNVLSIFETNNSSPASTTTSPLNITVLNYNRNGSGPVLNGTLVAVLVSNSTEKCPTSFNFSSNSSLPFPSVCSNRGTCDGDKGMCDCDSISIPALQTEFESRQMKHTVDIMFTGRACEQPVFPWPWNSDTTLNLTRPNSLVNNITALRQKNSPNVFEITIPAFETAIFHVQASTSGKETQTSTDETHTNVGFLLISQSLGSPERRVEPIFYPHVFNESDAEITAKDNGTLAQSWKQIRNQSECQLDVKDLPRSSLYERRFTDSGNYFEVSFSTRLYSQTKIYISVFANASKATDKETLESGAIVGLLRYNCTDALNCPPRAGILPLFLLPASLTVMLLCFAVIIVMLWLDRLHGFTNKVDRLTLREVDRMYPTYIFVPEQRSRMFDTAAAPEATDSSNREGSTNHRAQPTSIAQTESSTGEVVCSICLCPYEEGDVLRKLKCGHFFHATCVDPWITDNNATCPTCRDPVRIEELSDKRWMRKIVSVGLGPVVWARRRREERDAARLLQEDAENGRTEAEPNANSP